jgi:hypothetical protein
MKNSINTMNQMKNSINTMNQMKNSINTMNQMKNEKYYTVEIVPNSNGKS